MGPTVCCFRDRGRYSYKNVLIAKIKYTPFVLATPAMFSKAFFVSNDQRPGSYSSLAYMLLTERYMWIELLLK